MSFSLVYRVGLLPTVEDGIYFERVSRVIRCVDVVFLHVSAFVSIGGSCIPTLGTPIPRRNHGLPL